MCAYRFVVSKSECPITFCKAKDISAPAQIAGCECVPGCMERASWCSESEEQAYPLHVAQYVAAVEMASSLQKSS